MTTPEDWSEIEGHVAAFEAARARGEPVGLIAHLPPPGHRLRLAVLRELACAEMEMEWECGGCGAEDYARRFPELGSDPEAREALREQESRLRQGGRPPSAARPAPALALGWRDQAAALYEGHRRASGTEVTCHLGSVAHAELILQLEAEAPEGGWLLREVMPQPGPGSELLDFRLVRELGRGAFGQVFLAQQKGLADRLVALKVGAGLFDEAQTLAQLQHTHIVPVYSAHALGPLQAVCMPYFGPTTLADVLAGMRRHGGAPTVGNALWSTLRDRAPVPVEPPPLAAEPPHLPTSLEALRNLSHVRAVLLIGSRLADALAHAHERGVLHRDLKPANVLLADDGTPMLLDFNLSTDVRLRGGVPALLGGTLPYMAPEHLDAFRGGPGPVDERSDIYALGLILSELLTGRPIFPIPTGTLSEQVAKLHADRLAGPPPLRRLNRAVSPAVEAILARCLHPDPKQRYAQARQLQEDLQQQLDDLPLRHTPEPSRRERAAKFARRYPRLTWGGTALALLVILAGLGVLYFRQGQHVARVEAGFARLEHRDELRDARLLLGLPFPDPWERQQAEEACRRALGRYGLPDEDGWHRRPAVAALPADEQAALRADLGELLLLLARAAWLRGAVAEARRYNGQARELIAPGGRRAALLQQALLMRLAGEMQAADEVRSRALALPLTTPRDHYMLAGELAGQGRTADALASADEAVRLDPSHAAAWSARGACLMLRGEHREAAAAFTACIALRPGFWRAYVWRAQAYLELRDWPRAEADLTEALRQRALFAPALVLRALARIGRREYASAQEDLTAALKAEPGHTRAYFIRAHARRAGGDAAGAAADYQEGLRREPLDELSCVARGMARLAADPKGALADFDKALAINPRSPTAAQNKAHVLAERLDRAADAVAVLDGLVERQPDFTEARVGRAVLHARQGRRQEAHADAAESLRRDPRPLVQYQAACAYALTARGADDRAAARGLVEKALRGGFGAEHVEADGDLAALRQDKAEFAKLAALARRLKAAP